MDYTAYVICQDKSKQVFSGNDLSGMVILLLKRLESSSTFLKGEIMNNHTGKIMHCCWRVTKI